jgi:two-component system, OmpR family, alkaline phosphatase synthesis response regulator PhoP
MNPQILIVEDEPDILELLEYRLTQNSYDVLGFLNTKNVKRAIKEEDIDLIIMDRNLPDVEGSEFIAMLRDQGVKIPVIFLSAKNSQKEINEGFVRGADDYITKPFDMEELLLRIAVILKRSKPESNNIITTFRDIKLNNETRILTIADTIVDITKLEFELLLIFIENRSRVLDRDYLLKHVWKDKSHNQGRTVNVAINRLKEKIDPDKSKNYIKTVRGIGYRIE